MFVNVYKWRGKDVDKSSKKAQFQYLYKSLSIKWL